MTTDNATPRPWVERADTIYGGEYDQPIATLYRFDDGREKIDAALIVRAVNAHDELVAALKGAADLIAACHQHGCPAGPVMIPSYIHAALAKAGGG